ncbi:MAG TPA: iron ABC transporter permease [Candidatus Dojkabacteria bacterium]|nr:iron ABC transporter permease [Candidatus Dojkabacteria bacterium]
MENKKKHHFLVAVTILTSLLIISIVLGICIGSTSINIKEILGIIFYKIGITEKGTWTTGNENIIWLIRTPRALLAAVVGAGLAVSGASLQALLKNDLADPFTLGISSGASLGAVLSIGFGIFNTFGIFGIQVGGFLGAILAFTIVFYLSRRQGEISPTSLILAGIGTGYVFSGITSFITLVSSKKELAGQILSWTLGSLARADWRDLTIPSLVLIGTTIYLTLQSRNLNLIATNDEFASTLGLEVPTFRKRLFIIISLTVGVIVAVSGSIGFIGLIIPHIVRFFTGTNHKYLLPISLISGSIFLVWVDILARTVVSPAEVPAGVITSLLGGAFFLLLLWKKQTKAHK